MESTTSTNETAPRPPRGGETASPGPPLSVAALVRRARNAKSAKDRHDAAYFALEASVRIALAARPPEDPRPLARGSLGAWVAALRLPEEPLRAPALLSLHELLQSVVDEVERRPAAVSPRALLAGFVAYRNRVIGHGATRPAGFYGPAGEALLAGLSAAWEAGLFLPPGARLTFVESIALGRDGSRRARLCDLSGEAPIVLDPAGTPVEAHVLPDRVYLSLGATLRDLCPWLAYRADDLRERLYVFNGIGRGASYLDYASGEVLSGSALEGVFGGLAAEAAQLFGAADGGGPSPAEAGGERIGGYRLVRRIGAGGMGVVHLALDEGLGREVALKALPPALADDPRARARFRREVGALARCDHPNVVKILDAGESAGAPFFTMEYVAGADLATLARAAEVGDPAALASLGPPLERPRRLARIARDAALGLHHLHENGIVHRDVKPANIVIAAEDGRAVVMDLGAALTGEAALTLSRDAGRLTGTLRTMAPEQLRSGVLRVDRRADVYGLGATLYELLSGRPLFDGTTEAELVTQVLHDEPRPLARVAPRAPRDLAVIVHRCLRKDPRARYDTAEALARDLAALLASRPIAARSPTVGYLLRLAVRRNPAAYAVGAILSACLIASVVAGAIGLERERRLAEERAEIARGAFYRLLERAEERLVNEHSDLSRDVRRVIATTAVESLDALAAADGASVSTGTARALVALASAVSGDPVRFEQVSARALAAARSLAGARGPDDLDAQGILAAALGVRGEWAYTVVRIEEARAAFAEAATIGRRLDGDGVTQAVRRAGWLSWYETVEAVAGNPRPELLVEAEEVLRRWLSTARPEADARLARAELAQVLEARASRAATADPVRAASLRAEAASLRRALIAAVPGDAQRASFERGAALIREGDALGSAKDQAGALARYTSALAELRRFAAENPANRRARRYVAVALNRLGTQHEEAGRLPEAAALYDEALAMRRAARAERPDDFGARRDLCVSLELEARLLLRAGRVPEAVSFAEELARITRERVGDEGESAMTQADHLEAFDVLADVRLAVGDRAGAIAALEEAIGAVGPQEGRMPALKEPLEKARRRAAALAEEARSGGPVKREP